MTQTSVTGTPIEITGVTASAVKNIEIHLGVESGVIPLTALGFPRSNEFIIRKTKTALQALGYYVPEISLTGDHQLWQLKIVLGDPVQLKSIDIQLVGEGREDLTLKAAVSSHPFQINGRLDHGIYENFKLQLLSLASENGYLDANFITKEMLVDVESASASIRLILDTHQGYHIGHIEVKGTALSQRFLQRYLYIKEGDIYSPPAIIQTQQALNLSGYFSSINMEQQINADLHQVSLIFQLQDSHKYEFKTTLGFGTDSGAKMGASWQDRRFNEQGHQYIASVDMSEIEKSTSFQYTLPLEGKKNRLLYRYSYRIKDEALAESKLSSVETKVLLFHNDYWSSQTGLILTDESVDSNADISSHLNYLIPSWQLNYYSVKDHFTADTGWRWQNEIRASSDFLSNPDISFIQLEQRIKSIWALSDNWRLLARAQVGYTHMDSEQFSKNMPTSFRFFAGGDVSVRGYDYQTLSSKDSNGVVLGGKHLLTGSIELDWRFSDNLRAAIFSDTGSAFNQYSKMNLRRSVGLGLRWVTPIGSIRLDYAKALDELEEWRWHITIGPDL